jgi:hypothetical protein
LDHTTKSGRKSREHSYFWDTKLESAGLIKEIVGMYHGYTGGLITPTFKIFMKLIQYANESTFNFRLRQADAGK